MSFWDQLTGDGPPAFYATDARGTAAWFIRTDLDDWSLGPYATEAEALRSHDIAAAILRGEMTREVGELLLSARPHEA